MKAVYCIFLLAIFAISCQNKRNTGKQTEEKVIPMAGQQAAALAEEMPAPDSIGKAVAGRAMRTYLLDTTGTVKGYEVKKYKVQVVKDGTYEITSVSKNLGFIFVIQDADGNNVIDETNPSWTGKLQKGTYTVIAGLTRNAARRSDAQATFELRMRYISD